MAEWLGSGLQNRLRRFKSARDLNKILVPHERNRDFLFAGPANACLQGTANKKDRTPSGARILLMGQPKTVITAGNPPETSENPYTAKLIGVFLFCNTIFTRYLRWGSLRQNLKTMASITKRLLGRSVPLENDCWCFLFAIVPLGGWTIHLVFALTLAPGLNSDQKFTITNYFNVVKFLSFFLGKQ